MSETVNIVIPTIGESVSEGTIGRWFFKEGEVVNKDQPVLELDSDKATLEVPASATGKLKILVQAGKTAAVGSLVGQIETTASGVAPSATIKPEAPKPSVTKQEVAAPTQSSGAAIDLKSFGPAKRKAIREGSWTPPGSQAGIFIDESTRELRKPMSTLRKRIAERLLESQHSTATLTTFNEVDMSKVMQLRKELKESFEKKHGVKLGFMSFFAKAVIQALQQHPEVGARLEGDEIVYPQFAHLGVAVSTDRGLVVPIIRDAQKLGYGEIEKKILELAEKARTGKLQIPDMQGGTFTITNGGTFGSLLSTPILNPPQSGILGMHKIEQRAMAIEKNGKYEVEVRPMMYVALSYDHRIIDGATSVGFLVKVKDYLEKVTAADIV